MLPKLIQCSLLWLLLRDLTFSVCQKVPTRPNYVVIFADDLGYGDLNSYGHPTQEKGPVDVLVDEGKRFTQWYAAESLCSPSRAALLTGRLPIRSGIVGKNRVFHPHTIGGLPKTEVTIAEALQELGYETGIVGKWHLGINEFERNDGRHLPHHHGFNFVGHILPFTLVGTCDPSQFTTEEMARRCFLMYNDNIVEQPINLQTITEKMRNDSVSFIRQNSNKSFFLYLPLVQTHSKVFCSEKFCNSSRRGLYGDNVNEMSWLVGEVVDVLKSLHIDRNTLVFFISDHGPQTELCIEGGTTGGLRGRKASTWEGGIRVPSIAWWPGVIKPSTVSSEPISTMDVFPTLIELAGGQVKSRLDGISITSLLRGHDEINSPIHDVLFHYCSDKLFAVRVGAYKIHYHTQYPDSNQELCENGIPFDDILQYFDCDLSVPHNPPLIFNVESDPEEKYPLDPDHYLDLIKEAEQKVKQHKKTVVPVPSQLDILNPILRPCCNPPKCICGPFLHEKDEL